jgi:hypothetical protein
VVREHTNNQPPANIWIRRVLARLGLVSRDFRFLGRFRGVRGTGRNRYESSQGILESLIGGEGFAQQQPATALAFEKSISVLSTS